MAENLNFEYGFSAQGIEDLLAEVNAIVIKKAATHALTGVIDIRNTCERIWQGKSRDDFLTVFHRDAEKFSNSLKALYKAFEVEVVNAGASFNDFDKNLLNRLI